MSILTESPQRVNVDGNVYVAKANISDHRSFSIPIFQSASAGDTSLKIDYENQGLIDQNDRLEPGDVVRTTKLEEKTVASVSFISSYEVEVTFEEPLEASYDTNDSVQYGRLQPLGQNLGGISRVVRIATNTVDESISNDVETDKESVSNQTYGNEIPVVTSKREIKSERSVTVQGNVTYDRINDAYSHVLGLRDMVRKPQTRIVYNYGLNDIVGHVNSISITDSSEQNTVDKKLKTGLTDDDAIKTSYEVSLELVESEIEN